MEIVVVVVVEWIEKRREAQQAITPAKLTTNC